MRTMARMACSFNFPTTRPLSAWRAGSQCTSTIARPPAMAFARSASNVFGIITHAATRPRRTLVSASSRLGSIRTLRVESFSSALAKSVAAGPALSTTTAMGILRPLPPKILPKKMAMASGKTITKNALVRSRSKRRRSLAAIVRMTRINLATFCRSATGKRFQDRRAPRAGR